MVCFIRSQNPSLYILLLINLINKLRMIRRNQTGATTINTDLVFPKQINYSLSTEESPRPAHNAYNNKEKSQLCKKFIEHGYCPYQTRCKFAHGLHQLKKNSHVNCKYKTKFCGGFLQQGFCSFGNRCNFIHYDSQALPQAKNRDLDAQFLQIRTVSVQQSRLLKLLKD